MCKENRTEENSISYAYLAYNESTNERKNEFSLCLI